MYFNSNTFNRGVVGNAWHGYNDKSRDGTWEWENPSGKCKTYTRWNRGEPNNKKFENCGELYNNQNANWNDVPCSDQLASICEVGPEANKICPTSGKVIAFNITSTKILWSHISSN